jgi:hypothetical protein
VSTAAFFDDYPEFEPKERQPTCCDDLAGMPRLDQFIHVLAHSRVPFTVEAVADLAGSGCASAIAGLSKAIADGHIAVVQPEEHMADPTGLYIGRLVKRR